MKATISAGFLFLGSLMVYSWDIFPIDSSLGSIFLVLGGLSAVVLTCELIAACCREVVEFFSGLPPFNLKDLVTPPPAEQTKEDHDDDRSE